MVASPDDCATVKQCSANEVCFTQKFQTFGNTRYRMGCMDRKHCDTQPRTHVQTLVGRRATDDSDCDSCCMQDHCNIDACSLNASTTTYHLNSLSPNVVCNDTDVALCTTLGRLNSDSCKEQYVVSNCPKSCDVCDHLGWSSWKAWGRCGTTCEHGTKTRTRQCIHRWQKVNGLSCIGLPTDSSTCYVNAHCPINGGYCHETEYYDCQTHYNGIPINCKTRPGMPRYCKCPAPQYGGLGC